MLFYCCFLFFCCRLCFAVSDQMYESPLVLVIAISSEILHGSEFQCKSNEENPMQQ